MQQPPGFKFESPGRPVDMTFELKHGDTGILNLTYDIGLRGDMGHGESSDMHGTLAFLEIGVRHMTNPPPPPPAEGPTDELM